MLEQECIPVGYVPSAAVAVWGGRLPKVGVCLRVICLGGVSAEGGLWLGLGGGVYRPPVDRITDACENIMSQCLSGSGCSKDQENYD